MVKSSFFALLEPKLHDPPSTDIGEAAARILAHGQAARNAFPSTIRDSHLRLWKPGQQFCMMGPRLLFGVAVAWSLRDLDLLDQFDEQLCLHPEFAGRIDVFDFSKPGMTLQELHEYLPGIELFGYQTPLAGLWDDGQLQSTHVGFSAVQQFNHLVGCHTYVRR